jgi:hypothetical protein
LRIERVGAVDERPAPLTPAVLKEKLDGAARFVEGTARIFADWAQGFAAHPNRLPPQDQAPYQRAGGDPSIHYYHGYWALGPDEALVVRVPRVPSCETWNFQVDNYWMESLDYRWHRIHVNAHTAVPDGDGGVTIVVAARDPGRPNWLETAGHRVGTMCFRWIGAKEIVDPETRVAPRPASRTSATSRSASRWACCCARSTGRRASRTSAAPSSGSGRSTCSSIGSAPRRASRATPRSPTR